MFCLTEFSFLLIIIYIIQMKKRINLEIIGKIDICEF